MVPPLDPSLSTGVNKDTSAVGPVQGWSVSLVDGLGT